MEIMKQNNCKYNPRYIVMGIRMKQKIVNNKSTIILVILMK